MRYIYIYIYAEGHVVELAPPHKGENVQIAGVREKMFKLRD